MGVVGGARLVGTVAGAGGGGEGGGKGEWVGLLGGEGGC